MNRKIGLLLFCLVSFLIQNSEGAAPLRKFEVRNAAGRLAVCNDGSPAIYYFRPGSGNRTNTWLIYLGGGGFCYSAQSCNQRMITDPQLMSSNGYPSSLDIKGILSTVAAENPDFFNANHVVIPYLSSDFWSGNRPASQVNGGHQFRGIRIFRAIINDLQNQIVPGQPNLFSARKILLAGTSAGGIGVMVHLDWLAARLPHASVKGVNDAGWFPETFPFSPDFPSLSLFLRYARIFWNGSVDASCAAANPASRQRCYLSPVYPHLQSPLFVQMSQFDTVVLGALGVRFPFNTFERNVANLIGSSVRSSLVPVEAAFSPRTPTHGLLHSQNFTGIRIHGVTLRMVLGNWFLQRNGRIKVIQAP